jgi:hypothetical protein
MAFTAARTRRTASTIHTANTEALIHPTARTIPTRPARRSYTVVEPRNQLILELKAVEGLLPIHEAQVLTYMKLSGIRTGLLLNFNSVVLKSGTRRLML